MSVDYKECDNCYECKNEEYMFECEHFHNICDKCFIKEDIRKMEGNYWDNRKQLIETKYANVEQLKTGWIYIKEEYCPVCQENRS